MSVGRLSLGTAQLGTAYGVTAHGRPASEGEVTSILQTAVDLGVTAIDTAPGDGAAESRVGFFLNEHDLVTDVSVCTRLPPIGAVDPGRIEHLVEERLMGSLQRLRCDCIDCYLIQDGADLRTYGERLVDALLGQREKGRVLDIGLSAYAPDDLALLADHPALNVVQHPFSLLDRRLLQGDSLAQLRSNGTKLQVRGVLVYGLLVADPDGLPKEMAGARRALIALRGVLDELGLPIAQAAVAYALSFDADRIIISVDSAEQLHELRAAVDVELPSELDALLDEALGTVEVDVVDPRSWQQSG